MNFDAESHLNAMERSVSFLDRDGRPASAVTLSRSYATAVENLWDAVTNSERIPRWFTGISGELDLGGRYQLEGNAGGAITACEALSHYELTWEFAGDVSWVEVRLTDDGAAGIRVALTHTAHLSPHWDAYGPGAVGVGWEMGFLGLAFHLERPHEPRPDDMAFATSPDGKAFITGSSEGLGARCHCSRHEPRNRRCCGKAHDRILYWRICGSRMTHGRSCVTAYRTI